MGVEDYRRYVAGGRRGSDIYEFSVLLPVVLPCIVSTYGRLPGLKSGHTSWAAAGVLSVGGIGERRLLWSADVTLVFDALIFIPTGPSC